MDDPLLLKGGVYQPRTLSSEDYGRAIEGSVFSHAYVKTIVTPALFVASKQWSDKFPEKAATVKLQLNDFQKKIKREVEQCNKAMTVPSITNSTFARKLSVPHISVILKLYRPNYTTFLRLFGKT